MRFLITFFLAFGILSSFARQIPIDEAKEVAQNFLFSKSVVCTRGVNDATVKDLKLIENKILNSFHAFNIGDSEGFILVSAIGENPMVLAYSDKGSLNLSNLPPQLKGILDNASGFKDGNNFSTRANGNGVLYQTVDWGQGTPYNNLAPNNAAAGCVATAMAITMQYHQWPDYTRGGELFDWYFPDFKLNFDDYKIDWNVLSDKNNPKFNDEVSMLMKSTGIASHMLYGMNEFNESGAEVWAIGNRLIQLYAYDKECQYLEKESFDDQRWNQMLRHQLDEIGPVIYRGGSETAHCFVIDGYDTDGFYHVNWGWDGHSNGYYALDFSDVGGMNFGEYQGMIINIKPDKDRKEYSKAFISNANVYTYGDYTMSMWNFSTPDIDTGEDVYFIAPIVTLNGQQGFFRIGVVDENDNIIQILGDEPRLSYNYHSSFDDAPYCAHPGISLFFTLQFPPLKDGQRYQLVTQDATVDRETWVSTPSSPSNDPADYKLVLGGILNASYFYAKGNNSDYVKFNVHIDEDMPVWFESLNSDEKQFSLDILRYDGFADNLSLPLSGDSMEVIVTDKEGNVKDPVLSGYRYGYKYDMNISAYEDNYDVYLKYEKPENFRNDDEMSSDKVFEQDGLVYEILDKEVTLIGYDKNKIATEVTIPDFVTIKDVEHPLTKINHDALILAPVTDLNIESSHLTFMGNNAFGGIKNLENLSIKHMSDYDGYYYNRLPFLTSKITNIYFESVPSYGLANDLFVYGINWTRKASRDNVNVYQSAIPDVSDPYSYYSSWYYLSFLVNDQVAIDRIVGTLNIPGLGDTHVLKEMQGYNFTVKQMWEYTMDKSKGLLSLSNVSPDINIEEVWVNGNSVSPDKDGYYTLPTDAIHQLNIMVNYVVNETKRMTTTYSADYNNSLPSVSLEAGVNSISFDLNDEMDVYNLQGVKMLQKVTKEGLNSLIPGIYIIGNKKVLVN